MRVLCAAFLLGLLAAAAVWAAPANTDVASAISAVELSPVQGPEMTSSVPTTPVDATTARKPWSWVWRRWMERFRGWWKRTFRPGNKDAKVVGAGSSVVPCKVCDASGIASWRDAPNPWQRCCRFAKSISPVNRFLFLPPKRPADHLEFSKILSAHLRKLPLRREDSFDHWWKYMHRPAPVVVKRSRYFVIADIPSLAQKTKTAENHQNKDDGFVLVFFGGNAMDLEINYDFLRYFRSSHLRRIAVEYPGYGRLAKVRGRPPSEKTILEVARATVAWLVRDQQVPLSKIIVMGFSIGSGPATEVAQGLSLYGKHVALAGASPLSADSDTSKTEKQRIQHQQDLAGLVLIAPYKSIRHVARELLPVLGHLAVWMNRFHNLAKISDVTCPTLYIHGTRDSLIPPSHSQALMDAQIHAPVKYRFLEPVGHNEVMAGTAVLVLQLFLESFWDPNARSLFLRKLKLDHRVEEPVAEMSDWLRESWEDGSTEVDSDSDADQQLSS